MYRRAFGTHHMAIEENQGTTRGAFVAKGEIGATLQNWVDPHSHLYGVPPAINGLANKIGGHKDDKPGGNAPLSASRRLIDLNEFGDWVQKLRDLEAQWHTALAAVETPAQRKALYRDLIGRRTDIDTSSRRLRPARPSRGRWRRGRPGPVHAEPAGSPLGCAFRPGGDDGEHGVGGAGDSGVGAAGGAWWRTG